MRKLLVIGLVAGGAALTTVTSYATASSPVVPLRVQQAIKKRVNPLFAYVPESIPPGYHYLQWIHSRGGLTIWFAWHRDRDPQLGFNVGNNNPCPSAADPMRVFRFGGFKVYWSTTYEDAQAWRCVTRRHHRILVYVSAPGNGSKSGPSGLALARVIGSAHPIR
jgi:hypothetical protein